MGVGPLALPLLVRGRRGSVMTLVGALLGALCLMEMSGALLSDWFHMEIGRNLPVEQAVALSDKVLAHPAQQLAFSPGPLVSLALLLTFAGLARAGVSAGGRWARSCSATPGCCSCLTTRRSSRRWAPCRCSR